MRLNSISVDNNLIRECEVKFESAIDSWQPWQARPWLDLNERSLELLSKEKIKFTKKNIKEPFFSLSDKYMGMICDVRCVAQPGVDLLIFSHHAQKLIVIPQTVAIDKWHNPFVIYFKKSAVSLNVNDPICQMIPIWRSKACVKNFSAEDIKKAEKSGKHTNYEQFMKRYKEEFSRICPIIFKRGY